MPNEGLEIGEATFGDEPIGDMPAVELPELTGDEPVEVGVSDLGDHEQVVEVTEDTEEAFLERIRNGTATPEDRERLMNLYYPLPEDFPSKDELDAWEEEHGRIRIHRVAPQEAYVVRALTRAEFRQYLAILKSKFGNKETVDAAEERMVQEELLVERCTLWPKLTGKDIRGERNPETGRVHKVGLAGTVSILAVDIQEISNLIEANVGPFEEM